MTSEIESRLAWLEATLQYHLRHHERSDKADNVAWKTLDTELVKLNGLVDRLERDVVELRHAARG